MSLKYRVIRQHVGGGKRLERLVEAGWVSEVLGHFGDPPLAVAFYAVFEPQGEGGGVEILSPSFAFEERSDVGEPRPGFLGKPEEVVEVPTLDALDDTAKLLRADFLDGIDGKGNRIGEVWPDPKEDPFLDRLDGFVGREIEVDPASPGGAEWADVRDGRFIVFGELEMGEASMGPSHLQNLAQSGDSLPCTATEDSEVKVSGIALVGEVDETEGGAALEDEPSTVLRSGVVQLRDDMGEHVVPLHNSSVHIVGVRSAGEGVTGEHDQFPATARSSSALMFHATRKASSTQATFSSRGSRRTIDC
jgi:hypothetical protein